MVIKVDNKKVGNNRRVIARVGVKVEIGVEVEVKAEAKAGNNNGSL